jgi:AcrR family transcriptional regulator
VVRELLVERGYQALSIQEVTRRCGVHVRTVARRWDTKADVVAAAILDGGRPPASEAQVRTPTGDLRRDLHAEINDLLRFLAAPTTRAALPALWSEMWTDPALKARLDRRQQEWAAAIQAIVEQAVAAGDVPELALDRAHLLAHLIAGTAMSTQLVHGPSPGPDLASELTDFLVGALRAPLTTTAVQP